MTRVYNREDIEVESETNNVLIHICIMVCISVFFIVYFDLVEHNPILQEQIKQNSTIIPIGQILAFEGYYGYILLKITRRWQENIKIEKTLSSVAKASVKIFHEYAMWFIDMVAIYIITREVFIYC